MIMMRHRFPTGFPRHCGAAAPLPAPPQPGDGTELSPALHGEGHDHIGGGGGTPPIAADPVIDLCDGTRIVFATSAGPPARR